MPCAKGMTGCRRSCLHRALVGDYHVAREASELLAEAKSRGYATERAECPVLTFKEWLTGTAGSVATQQEEEAVA
jgi:hypothetical protein